MFRHVTPKQTKNIIEFNTMKSLAYHHGGILTTPDPKYERCVILEGERYFDRFQNSKRVCVCVCV